MTPGKVRRESLKTLRATRRAMLSSAWTGALRRADRPTRKRAAHALLDLQAAIDVVETAELARISAAMAGNEEAIARGIERLSAALQNLNRVKTVLDATEKLLALGQRIAPLLIGVA